MPVPDVIKILGFSLLKMLFEQIFGNLNLSNFIKNNKGHSILFLINVALFALLWVLSREAYLTQQELNTYVDRLKLLQTHFASIVPDGTRDEDIVKVINQKLFRQRIDQQRCQDELEIARLLLLERQLTKHDTCKVP